MLCATMWCENDSSDRPFRHYCKSRNYGSPSAKAQASAGEATRATYLESSFGDLDLDLDTERCPFLSLDLAGDLSSERRSDLRDGERDFERLRSLSNSQRKCNIGNG